jgi:hypothetical protein
MHPFTLLAPGLSAPAVWALLALGTGAVALPAQFPYPGTLMQGQGQGQGQGQQPGGLEPIEDQFRLRRQWVQRPDAFQGFPVFPQNLTQYGIYPPPPGWGQPPTFAGPIALPHVSPTAPDWPAWIKGKAGAPLPYEIGRVVLVRQSDRVWFRTKGDDAFVPLYHWDFVRSLAPGDEVKVDGSGEFMLQFHGGALIDAIGPTSVAIDALDAKEARCTVRAFTHLRFTALARPLVLALPDGSTIATEAPEAPASPNEVRNVAALPSELLLERTDEPGRYRGRATLFNSGSVPARWQTAFGEVLLEPGRRVTFFLTPPVVPLSAALVEDKVRAEPDGPVRRWNAVEPASVTWSGARFQLPAGSSLQIDPMLGDPFAAPPAANKPAAAASPGSGK